MDGWVAGHGGAETNVEDAPQERTGSRADEMFAASLSDVPTASGDERRDSSGAGGAHSEGDAPGASVSINPVEQADDADLVRSEQWVDDLPAPIAFGLRLIYVPLVDGSDSALQRTRKIAVCASLLFAMAALTFPIYVYLVNEGSTEWSAAKGVAMFGTTFLTFGIGPYVLTRRSKTADNMVAHALMLVWLFQLISITIAISDVDFTVAWYGAHLMIVLVRPDPSWVWHLLYTAGSLLAIWNTQTARSVDPADRRLALLLPGWELSSHLSVRCATNCITIAVMYALIVVEAKRHRTATAVMDKATRSARFSRHIAKMLVRYHTDRALTALAREKARADSGQLSKDTATGEPVVVADSRMLKSFQLLAQNLATYRQHIPNWLINDDGADGDRGAGADADDDEMWSAGAPSDSIGLTPRTPHSHGPSTLASARGKATPRAMQAGALSNAAYDHNDDPDMDASLVRSRHTGSARSLSTRSLDSPQTPGSPAIVSGHPSFGRRAGHPQSPLSKPPAIPGPSTVVGQLPASPATVPVVVAEIHFFVNDYRAAGFRAISGGLDGATAFVDAVFRHANDTHGAVHAFVGDKAVISWNAVAAVHQKEAKAARFLARLKAEMTHPQVEFGGGAFAGVARAAMSGSSQRSLTLHAGWWPAFEQAVQVGRKHATLIVNNSIRSNADFAVLFHAVGGMTMSDWRYVIRAPVGGGTVRVAANADVPPMRERTGSVIIPMPEPSLLCLDLPGVMEAIAEATSPATPPPPLDTLQASSSNPGPARGVPEARVGFFEVVKEMTGDAADGEWMYVLDEQRQQASGNAMTSSTGGQVGGDQVQQRHRSLNVITRAIDLWLSEKDEAAVASLSKVDWAIVPPVVQSGMASLSRLAPNLHAK